MSVDTTAGTSPGGVVLVADWWPGPLCEVAASRALRPRQAGGPAGAARSGVVDLSTLHKSVPSLHLRSAPASHLLSARRCHSQYSRPYTPSSSTTLHSASTAASSASSMLSVVPVPVPLGVIGEVIDEYMDMICWRDSVKAEGKKSGNRLGVGFRVGARARVLTWEEALDEGEDEHMPQGRERDNEDDHKGHQRHQVLEDTPQQLHLIRGCTRVSVAGLQLHLARAQRVPLQHGAAEHVAGELYVLRDELDAAPVELDALHRLVGVDGPRLARSAPREGLLLRCLQAELKEQVADAHLEPAELFVGDGGVALLHDEAHHVAQRSLHGRVLLDDGKQMVDQRGGGAQLALERDEDALHLEVGHLERELALQPHDGDVRQQGLLQEGVAVAAHEEGSLELLLPLHQSDARAQLGRLRPQLQKCLGLAL
eukprot:scaffold865_cov65-Phaeocystis_antarctica.AAC.14